MWCVLGVCVGDGACVGVYSCCVRASRRGVSGSFDGVGRDCRDMIIDAHSRVMVVLVVFPSSCDDDLVVVTLHVGN